jgi:hypothetical protein
MNTRIRTALAALTLLSSFILHPSSLLGQGSLTPPGPPGPTMKTLAQIEPRTPISAVPYTITNSGSYYLTTNLTVATGNAITIATNGVTLDLMGFTIASTAPSATGTAILLNSGLNDLSIFNGHIRSGVTNNGSGNYSGSGFQHGINSSGTDPANTRVTGLSVSGCLSYAIYLGVGLATVADSCAVRTVGDGILASTIKSSVALDCGGDALYGVAVSDSWGQSTGSGYGLRAASSAENCYGNSASGTGLYAGNALNCSGASFGSVNNYGLRAASTAENCYGYIFGSGTGLQAGSALNSEGYNEASGTGLYALTAQNCSGTSGGGTGLLAYDLAIGCRGWSGSGTGLSAYIANSCRVVSGTTNVSYKYNMP